MKRDMIFFSPDGQGLTSTSASYIANLAKEMIRGLEAEMATMVLYSTSVALIGTQGADTLVAGAEASEVEDMIGKLHAVAKAKSLIAWLREAIKAKERLYKEASAMSLEKFAETEGITIPKMPKQKDPMTEDDYYATLTIDARNRYYHTETLAAVLGQAIHPGGTLADAREALIQHIREPREVRGEGRDTLIYTFEPTVDPATVDDVYFRLQKQYREAQAKVNSFKHDCKKAMMESATAVSTAYTKELTDYNQEMSLLRARQAEYIKKHTAEIENYRILIPQGLKDIYDRVSDLGKK